jgi:crotonobetainyl-CoA:carnitine CoA-transferase CaiB-like acyl-CoA transferase
VEHDVDEVVRRCQESRVTAVPVQRPAELHRDPQLLARGFFEAVESPHGPSLVMRMPFHLDGLQPPAAPRLGKLPATPPAAPEGHP